MNYLSRWNQSLRRLSTTISSRKKNIFLLCLYEETKHNCKKKNRSISEEHCVDSNFSIKNVWWSKWHWMDTFQLIRESRKKNRKIHETIYCRQTIESMNHSQIACNIEMQFKISLVIFMRVWITFFVFISSFITVTRKSFYTMASVDEKSDEVPIDMNVILESFYRWQRFWFATFSIDLIL